MPTRISAGLVGVALCLLCAGCVHYATTAQREATFARGNDAKVGPDSLEKYLLQRSSLVLVSKTQVTNPVVDTNTLELSASGRGEMGMAAAIDKRGYFLTAAHCVGIKGHVWIVINEPDGVEAKEARVVWRGDDLMPDLAVLCISSPVEYVFEWATEFTNGIPVYGAGFNYDEQSRKLDLECMAGKALSISDGWAYPGPHYTAITHDAPLRAGDSGGPLALPDGRLLGINVGMHRFRLRRFSCEAHRPNREMLQGIIEKDAKSQAALSPNKTLQPTAAGPGVSGP